MKVKIRLDGSYDLTHRSVTYYALDRKTLAAKLRLLGVSTSEWAAALDYRNPGDNVLHFGIKGTFIFSECDVERYGVA